ncbi:MAG: GAF domain-containing protein [Desulfobacterota bacterium]|nr:GAF domain-containing protein [Thermodesulfobacteriota bacterium]MDW8001385.1 HD domain-containing phosphohydrolase [Deltaproteobacteria bacterium]
MDVLKRLKEIGIALSKEKDIMRLFDMIVESAMEFTKSDGGTLYIVSEDKKSLEFAIVRNKTLGIRTNGIISLTPWESVPLLNEDGSPNYSNVSSYCALTGKTVSIDDVYDTKIFNFEKTKDFDLKANYRSKSMLVVPMKNHEAEIIGVLQLINAKDEITGKVIPFSQEDEELIECLASQAAIALTNRMLINDLEELFQSFIRAITSAIDEKSPYTRGHAERVTQIAVMLAQKINETNLGPFANTYLTDDEIEEIKIAAILHDVGKVSIPEHILDKATKLHSLLDRIELIRLRYEILKREYAFFPEKREELKSEMELLERINLGLEPVTESTVEKLEKIGERTWQSDRGEEPFLKEEELQSLCVKRGTLTEKEKKIVNSHAEITYKILSNLRFPKKLKNVPFIASSHHEKLNGKGYPRGIDAKSLPLQSRIISIADIFEALTAKDRPYRASNTRSEALIIMEKMAKDGEIDKDLFELFVSSGIPELF